MADAGTAYDEARKVARVALRGRLLQVAADLLEAEGLDALSMRPLARAAGCSTMVFYTEFGSKTGLLEALADERASHLVEIVETVADVDPLSHRQAVVTAFLDEVAARPEGYRLLTRAASDDDAVLALASERRARLDGRLLAALHPSGDAEPERYLQGLVLALHGAAERIVAGAEDVATVLPRIEALLAAGARGDR